MSEHCKFCGFSNDGTTPMVLVPCMPGKSHTYEPTTFPKLKRGIHLNDGSFITVEEIESLRKDSFRKEYNRIFAENDKLRDALIALNETHCAPGCTHEGEGKEYSEAYRIANAKVGVALATK